MVLVPHDMRTKVSAFAGDFCMHISFDWYRRSAKPPTRRLR
jgi:hypothetical protein